MEPNPTRLHGLFDATIKGKRAVVEYEPDTDLRDTEQVPLLQEGGFEAFIRREVLPYASDAWYVPGQREGWLRDQLHTALLQAATVASLGGDTGGHHGFGAGDRWVVGGVLGGGGERIVSENQGVDAQRLDIHMHLEIMQGVISRMADNSRSCKVWCVTLVAATLVLVARTGEADHALIAVAPAALLYLLDAYYLMLERRFRNSYDGFVDKVHSGQVAISNLYKVTALGSKVRTMLWAMFQSFSVLPFYSTVIVTILLAWRLIL